MCFVLYMASDKPRREIAWDEKAPAFHVKAGDADAETARGQFSKSYVYYLGSSGFCGCGFRRDPDWVYEQLPEEERQDVRDNQTRLHAYVKECLADEDSIELFGCWNGDEAQEAQNRREIHVDELVGRQFYFDDHTPELLIVSR